ncbi:MAG TPA: 16S rRNA (adenine(1518)-N(6)/adenine(1519)-N(6))-dimethyltransferase RsmA [Polyangiaceae bacterium]|nr:16S rRNA (adenine(1518)-N(6)/adenine(1519)-N(6))-dimethyltransferase RsmA [Polyangiaceae bacterium]
MSDTPRSPKAQLESRGLRPKRHFGQNFLADEHLALKIAELVPRGASVVELGAGLGALTRPLLTRAARLVAVERDRDLVPALAELFADEIASGKMRVEEADAKSVSVSALLAGAPKPHVLAGNLPYQISGPLLEAAVNMAGDVEHVIFLLQLEVVDRLVAAPDSEHYGALSVFVQAAFEVERALVIRRGAFYPQPDVDSAVVAMTPHAERVPETSAFRALVRAAFQKRRKKLRNAWEGVAGRSREDLAACAARAKIDLDARGETLAVLDFARMARELDA